MRSRPLMTLRLSTAPTQKIGAGPHGTRLTFPVTGGSFDGDRLRGKVLPGGDDWVVKRADGVLELDLPAPALSEDHGTGDPVVCCFTAGRCAVSPGKSRCRP
jgi:hypothetical protein